jgi:hypothetical protein
MNEEEKREKYRMIFKGLDLDLQQACREWANREKWDEILWIETLEWVIGRWKNYKEAAVWIREHILNEKNP